MITEDYVSFEVAKLLKEKRFNEPCYSSYKKGVFSLDSYMMTNTEFNNNAMSAPTLQMAMKWLRRACAIEISIACFSLDVYRYDIYEINSSNFSRQAIEFNSNEFISYEDACEAAIKYCLTNLI